MPEKVKENTKNIEIHKTIEIIEILINEIKERLELLVNEKHIKLKDIDKNKVKNSIIRIVGEKNIEIEESIEKQVNIIIDLVINALLKSNEDYKVKSNINNDIKIKDIFNEINFLFSNYGLKNEKILISKIILQTIISESLRILAIKMISNIDSSKENLFKIFTISIAGISSETFKFFKSVNSQKLSEKIRENLIKDIAKISLDNPEKGYLITTAFVSYGHLINGILNKIFPNILAITFSSMTLFSMNKTLGITAIGGFIGIGLSGKKSSQKHTKSHGRIIKLFNKIILKNKNYKDTKKELELLSKNISMKEKMSYLSQYLRALPSYSVEILMILEYSLFLKNNVSIMELIASILLIRGMRTPIAFIIKAWYEDIAKAVKNTQCATQILKNELKI